MIEGTLGDIMLLAEMRDKDKSLYESRLLHIREVIKDLLKLQKELKNHK